MDGNWWLATDCRRRADGLCKRRAADLTSQVTQLLVAGDLRWPVRLDQVRPHWSGASRCLGGRRSRRYSPRTHAVLRVL